MWATKPTLLAKACCLCRLCMCPNHQTRCTRCWPSRTLGIVVRKSCKSRLPEYERHIICDDFLFGSLISEHSDTALMLGHVSTQGCLTWELVGSSMSNVSEWQGFARGTIVYIPLPARCTIRYMQKLLSNKALACGSTTTIALFATCIEPFRCRWRRG